MKLYFDCKYQGLAYTFWSDLHQNYLEEAAVLFLKLLDHNVSGLCLV